MVDVRQLDWLVFLLPGLVGLAGCPGSSTGDAAQVRLPEEQRRAELKEQLRRELKEELRAELKEELRLELLREHGLITAGAAPLTQQPEPAGLGHLSSVPIEELPIAGSGTAAQPAPPDAAPLLMPTDADDPPPDPTRPPPQPEPPRIPVGIPDPHLTVLEATMAQRVEQRSPVEPGIRFAANQEPVYAFAILSNLAGPITFVRFVWRYQGTVRAESRVRVGVGSGWRTWAFHTIPRQQAGDWIVELQTDSGVILRTLPFTIVP